jgi:hypothetical protein
MFKLSDIYADNLPPGIPALVGSESRHSHQKALRPPSTHRRALDTASACQPSTRHTGSGTTRDFQSGQQPRDPADQQDPGRSETNDRSLATAFGDSFYSALITSKYDPSTYTECPSSSEDMTIISQDLIGSGDGPQYKPKTAWGRKNAYEVRRVGACWRCRLMKERVSQPLDL